MSKKPSTSRFVSSSCFEQLHIAIVQFILNESIHKNNAEVSHAILENMGYMVGQKSSERMTATKARFGDEHLDVIKFLCKDFWTEWFGKQVDHLRTNHRGTYVLTDNDFVFLSKMSVGTHAETLQLMKPYLAFPCGLLRGALSNLGVEAFVTAEIQTEEDTDKPKNTVVFKIQEK